MYYSQDITTYASQDPKPYYRGYLHNIVSINLPLVILIFSILYSSFWQLQIYLLGKFICYSYSSILHSGYLRDINYHLLILKLDKIGVYISIFVNGIPFITNNNEQILYLYTNSLILIIGTLGILYDYEYHRKFIFFFYMLGMIYFVGYKCYFNLLYLSAISFYLLSLILFIPNIIENNHSDKMVEVTLNVFWHQKGRNGCHEDFHSLLFIADVLQFLNGYYYLKQNYI